MNQKQETIIQSAVEKLLRPKTDRSQSLNGEYFMANLRKMTLNEEVIAAKQKQILRLKKGIKNPPRSVPSYMHLRTGTTSRRVGSVSHGVS